MCARDRCECVSIALGRVSGRQFLGSRHVRVTVQNLYSITVKSLYNAPVLINSEDGKSILLILLSLFDCDSNM